VNKGNDEMKMIKTRGRERMSKKSRREDGRSGRGGVGGRREGGGT
jgi:hypothetical protein